MYFNLKREKLKKKKKKTRKKCRAGTPMQLDKKTNRQTDRKISERGRRRQMNDVAREWTHAVKTAC